MKDINSLECDSLILSFLLLSTLAQIHLGILLHVYYVYLSQYSYEELYTFMQIVFVTGFARRGLIRAPLQHTDFTTIL